MPSIRLRSLSVLVVLAAAAGGCVPGDGTGTPDPGRERVVLLHGLGRTSRSMVAAERFLRDAGYEAHNLDYPSRRETLEEIADGLVPALGSLCDAGGPPVHAVTHSMGGILLRLYVERHGCPQLARVVMLGPPNQGSELSAPFGGLVGPAGAQLGTGEDSVPARLGPVEFELGVIVGSRSLNPLGSAMISGEDDGAVSHESARVDGMRDFLVMPATHSFIMYKSDVLEQVVTFLRTGSFAR